MLDGGGGIDTAVFGNGGVRLDLTLTGAQTTGEGFKTLLNIENLTAGSGGDRLIGDGAANVLTGGDGDDTLEGGGGNDTAVFTGTRAQYDIADADANGVILVTGIGAQAGAGADQLKNIRFARFDNNETVALINAGPDSLALSKTSVAENTLVNTIVANLSAHDADGDALTYSLVSDAGGVFRLDGTDLLLAKTLDYETTQQYTVTIKATDFYGKETTKSFLIAVTDVAETIGTTGGTTPLILVGTPWKDTLNGGDGNDIIKGFGRADILVGGGGNDKLYGGLGKDILTGSAGQDVFVFDTKPGETNLDRITDFSVPDDTIYLAKAIFSKIAKKGVLAKAAFHVGEKAHDATDRIIYNKKIGALFYDSDGNGALKAVEFATLARNLKMNEKDFFVL
jgi:hypothetical protein